MVRGANREGVLERMVDGSPGAASRAWLLCCAAWLAGCVTQGTTIDTGGDRDTAVEHPDTGDSGQDTGGAGETDCANDLDDDGDGRIDCDDRDCMGEPTCQIGAWLPGFQRPGVYDTVHDRAGVRDLWQGFDDLLVGSFDEAGGRPATGVAAWDGERFAPVEVPFELDSSEALTVAYERYDDAGLLIGGDFEDGGYRNVALRTPPGHWSMLAGGVDGRVDAAAEYVDGTLYVGGEFATAGGTPAANVARWDGSSWQALGSGVDGPVHELVYLGFYLYVIGSFTEAGGLEVPGVARWHLDDQQWETMGDPAALEGSFSVAATDGARIFVGGQVDRVGEVDDPALDVAAFDPQFGTWEPAASSGPRSAEVRGLYAGGLGLWASGPWVDGERHVGASLFHVADGVSEVMGCGLDEGSTAVGLLGTVGGGVYLAGSLHDAGLDATAQPPGYNGMLQVPTFGAPCESTAHGIQGTSYDDAAARVGALLSDGSLLHVGGSFATVAGRYSPFLATWDAGEGAWLPWSDTPDAPVHALHREATTGRLYAGGEFSAMGELSVGRLGAWDGDAWSEVGGGVEGGPVRALAQGADGTLYVGGGFDTAGSTPANGIAAWDGAAWSPLGGGVLGVGAAGVVHALLVLPDGRLVVGGAFQRAGGASAPNLAVHDPALGTWEPLGAGVGGTVRALYLRGDRLFVGGDFTTAGAIAAPHVAIYDLEAGSWSSAGDGFDGPVHALAAHQGLLVAAGAFERAVPYRVGHAARWHDDRWWSLDAGTDGPVHAAAFVGDVLYAGGAFATAGDEPSLLLAAFEQEAR